MKTTGAREYQHAHSRKTTNQISALRSQRSGCGLLLSHTVAAGTDLLLVHSSCHAHHAWQTPDTFHGILLLGLVKSLLKSPVFIVYFTFMFNLGSLKLPDYLFEN